MTLCQTNEFWQNHLFRMDPAIYLWLFNSLLLLNWKYVLLVWAQMVVVSKSCLCVFRSYGERSSFVINGSDSYVGISALCISITRLVKMRIIIIIKKKYTVFLIKLFYFTFCETQQSLTDKPSQLLRSPPNFVSKEETTTHKSLLVCEFQNFSRCAFLNSIKSQTWTQRTCCEEKVAKTF